MTAEWGSLEMFLATRRLGEHPPEKLQDAIDQLFPLHDVNPKRQTDLQIMCFLMGVAWFAYHWGKGRTSPLEAAKMYGSKKR